MSARVSTVGRKESSVAWHAAFLTMMPVIKAHARIAFRHLGAEAREEAVHNVVCNACCAFARLAELGKTDVAYPTVLARYGVAQVKAGRKVGCRLNINDITSDYCRRWKNVTVERLDNYDIEQDAWQEVVVEDKHAGPAEVAATRIDFAQWLKVLPKPVCEGSPPSWPTTRRLPPPPRGFACRRAGSARSASSCTSPGASFRATHLLWCSSDLAGAVPVGPSPVATGRPRITKHCLQ